MSELICEYCDCELTEETAFFYDDHVMCQNCLDENTCVCDHCGDRIWASDAIEENDYVLCRHCYDNEFTTCGDCGCLISNDDACYEDGSDEPLCERCYHARTKDMRIRNYYYKPTPIFYGEGPLYIGIELEIDEDGHNDTNAGTLIGMANAEVPRIYCKHDGSLDDGFEIVSHPMTLDYHRNCMNWREIFRKAIDMGYLSHQTNTCGLHCHVSRAAFGITEAEQEEVIARIVYFVEAHWNELLKFSRRTVECVNRWASRYGISEDTYHTYKNAKDSRRGRYVAVNLENRNTIEFRIFRGTLNYNTFIATLQLVDKICRLCIDGTDEEVESMSWGDFISDVTEPELLLYLKTRNLYINEPVHAGEEV